MTCRPTGRPSLVNPQGRLSAGPPARFAGAVSRLGTLIEAVNILGSLFYGPILGLFITAFYLRNVRGSAVFWGALMSESLILTLFFTTKKIGYLWYNPIGCIAVCLFALALQKTIFASR